jgi:hypothetical protein
LRTQRIGEQVRKRRKLTLDFTEPEFKPSQPMFVETGLLVQTLHFSGIPIQEEGPMACFNSLTTCRVGDGGLVPNEFQMNLFGRLSGFEIRNVRSRSGGGLSGKKGHGRGEGRLRDLKLHRGADGPGGRL